MARQQRSIPASCTRGRSFLTRLSIGLFCLYLAAVIGSCPASAQPPAPDPRFGIVETYVNPAAASEAGAGYTRIILRWDVIQPASPVDWKPANVPDPVIEEERAAGRQVVAVLIGTPAWASAQGGRGARDVPDMLQWEAFARRVAEQYRGRIHHWIIWNEPDVWDENHPGSTWTGTEEDYYRLLKTAYLAIKAVDPAEKVYIAGLTYYWDWAHGRRRYLDRLLDVVTADPEAPAHGYYFDGAIYHLYFNAGQTVEVLEETKQALRRHGIQGKELWINETNAPPSEDPQELPWSPPRFRVSLEEQAAFVLQEFALAFSSGASRVEIYKMRNSADHPESIEPFGLLRADNSPRPAFAAYRVATTHLAGFRSVSRQRLGDIVAVTFDIGDRFVTVLWTTGRRNQRARVLATAPEATLVEVNGDLRQLKSSGGAYEVELSGATCRQPGLCMIGGTPRLLIQAGRPDLQRVLLVADTPPPTPQRPRATPPCRGPQP